MSDPEDNIYEIGDSSIWVAAIKLDGKYLRLGFFSNKFDAQAAYEAAVMKYAHEYAGGNN